MQDCQAFRSKLRRYAALALVIGFVAWIASFALGKGILAAIVAFPAFVVGIVLFIYSFMYSRQIVKHRNRCQVLKELSTNVLQDAGSRASFSVRLSLQNCSKLTSDEPWGARKNGKQQFFQEEWIALGGGLLDGTAFSESITELLRLRTFTNPRGKRKTKTRSRYLLNLRFDYPADLYGDPRLVHPKPMEEIRVPASATVRDVRITEQTIAVKAIVLNPEELLQTSAMLSLAVYQMLKSSRRLASRGGAR